MDIGRYGWNVVEKNFENNNENAIEFLSGERYASATFTNRKHKARIKELYTERGDEFQMYVENKDGSIFAKFPLKWVKINPGSKNGRTMTDEQRNAARDRLAEARKNRLKNLS